MATNVINYNNLYWSHIKYNTHTLLFNALHDVTMTCNIMYT